MNTRRNFLRIVGMAAVSYMVPVTTPALAEAPAHVFEILVRHFDYDRGTEVALKWYENGRPHAVSFSTTYDKRTWDAHKDQLIPTLEEYVLKRLADPTFDWA